MLGAGASGLVRSSVRGVEIETSRSSVGRAGDGTKQQAPAPSTQHPAPSTEHVSASSRPRALVSWSGGKDSCLALMRAASTYDVRAMITMFDEGGTRSRSHGLRPEIVAAQAERLGLRSIAAFCSWATYEEAFVGGLAGLADEGFTHIIFGDIFEDAHRAWTERVAARAGLAAV